MGLIFKPAGNHNLLFVLALANMMVLVPVATGSPSHTYYIAVDGNDGYPGSQAQPWRTVDHAARTIEPGDTVVMMGGVYRVTDLGFGPPGLSFDQMTTYKSAPGARVILSGDGDVIRMVGMADFIRLDGLWFRHYCVAPGGSPIGHGKEIINCTIFCSNGGILIGSLEYLLVYGNRLIHTGSTPYGHGIYLSGGYLIGSRSNHVIVDNNIFIHGEGYGIHGWHGAKSMIVTRNLVAHHDNGIVMDGSDHVIANNLVWGGEAGIFVGGENIVAVNNILRECPWTGLLGMNHLERNAVLNTEPQGLSSILLTPGNEQADLGVPASVIDETVEQLGEIFDQPVEILYQDQRVAPLFAKLRMTIPDGSSLKDAGHAWYEPGKTVNLGPDTDQPACLNTLWYAFREWGLQNWDKNGNVYEPNFSGCCEGRTPDDRDNDVDGTANDSDPDDDEDGLPDEQDRDRDGDGVEDDIEIILAKDPDSKTSVPPASPFLELSQDVITLKSVYGRDPPGVILTLRNRGAGTLNWSAATSALWVTLDAVAGSLGTAAGTSVEVRFRTQALPVGSYTAELTFTYGQHAALVPVKLEVLKESAIEEGLLHRWTFDEGGGNTAHDQIGGADATIYGAEWTDGTAGPALHFDGIDDYVDLPESVDDFSQFTVMLWFKTTVSGADTYGAAYFSDNTMWQLYITAGADGGEISLHTAGGQLRAHFNLDQPADARALWSSGAPVNNNQWHHAALTICAHDEIALYQDGVQVVSKKISDDTAAINRTKGELSVGRSVWWGPIPYYYSGEIDDIRLYSRPLYPAEIAAICSNNLLKAR